MGASGTLPGRTGLIFAQGRRRGFTPSAGIDPAGTIAMDQHADIPHPSLRATIGQALLAGSVASVLSAGALTLAGRRENRSGAAPINAVSHWYWGDEALRRRRIDLAHTATGYSIHHGASVFWAGLFAWVARYRPVLRTPGGIAWGSLATSALACFVDFRLTPERLTPGFEHRLSRPALAAIYATFAIGLAVGALAVLASTPSKTPARHSDRRRRAARGNLASRRPCP